MIDRIKAINALSYLALGAGFVLVLLVGFWAISNDDPLTMQDRPLEVRTIREYPTADGVVILTAEYCKNVEARGRVRTSFVSQSREVFLPVSTESSDPGCYKQQVPVVIPHDIPPGEYKVKFSVQYQVNPIKRVTEEFVSEPFDIVAAEV